MGRPDYSKVDSTPQERDRINMRFDYEHWLQRITKSPILRHDRQTARPPVDVLVEIETMKPGVTSVAADLARPFDLIGDDRMEMHIQSNKAGYR